MTILTNKMNTVKNAREVSDLQFFMPFNEGAGNDFADIKGDVSVTTTGSSHLIKYAATMGFGGTANAPTNGSVPNLIGKNIVAAIVGNAYTAASFFTLGMGNGSSGFSLRINGLATAISSTKGASAIVAPTAPTLEQSWLLAISFSKETGLLTLYEGLNGGSVSQKGTADASAHLTETAMDNTIEIMNTAVKQDVYSAHVRTPESLSAETDMLAYLDSLYQHNLAGRKFIGKTIAAF